MVFVRKRRARPLIDDEARETLDRHLSRLQRDARVLRRLDPGAWAERGCFFAPTIAEIPSPDFLDREVFGPILQVYRYRSEEFKGIAAGLAARGYGLTLGICSRIGAVVGVQPLGATACRALGQRPLALMRLCATLPNALSVNITAQGGDPALLYL